MKAIPHAQDAAERAAMTPEQLAERDARLIKRNRTHVFYRTHDRLPDRKPMPIPEDFDPQHEARRAKQGGCCGKPSE